MMNKRAADTPSTLRGNKYNTQKNSTGRYEENQDDQLPKMEKQEDTSEKEQANSGFCKRHPKRIG